MRCDCIAIKFPFLNYKLFRFQREKNMMNSVKPNIVNENQYILFFFSKKKPILIRLLLKSNVESEHIEQTRWIFYFLNFHNPNESKHVRKINIIDNEKKKNIQVLDVGQIMRDRLLWEMNWTLDTPHFQYYYHIRRITLHNTKGESTRSPIQFYSS